MDTMEKEMQAFLEGFKLLRQMKESLDQNCCHGGGCEDEEEDEEDCELMESLNRDYNDVMNWVFGKEGQFHWSKNKALKVWKKLHPALEAPRVLRTEKSVNPTLSTLCLFLDAYPMYLAEKKKCCG